MEMADPGSRLGPAPEPEILGISDVVFRRQRGDPQVRLPQKFAQRDLILAKPCRLVAVGPGLQQGSGLRGAAHRDDAGVELRKGVGQGKGPDGAGGGAIAGMGMGHGDVEPIQQVEQLANIVKHTDIGIQKQRPLERRAHQAIHLRASMRAIKLYHRIEEVAQRDTKPPGIGEQGNRNVRHVLADRAGGGLGAGDIARAGRHEYDAATARGPRRIMGFSHFEAATINCA